MSKISDTLIKIISLGTGLALGIVLIAKIFFELSYDSFYRDIDRVYIIRTNMSMDGEVSDFTNVSGGVAAGFMHEVPGVEAGTRTTYIFNGNKYSDEDGNVMTAALIAADTCFFRVFDRPILAGDPVKALGKWGAVMVSRSFAEKLGGVQACLGQQIFNKDMEELKLTVEGVFEDFPVNGSLHFDLLLSLETYSKESAENWLGNDRYTGYVRLMPGVDPNSLTEAIRKMQEAHQPMEEIERQGIALRYYLAPFDKMHTSDPQVRSQVILLSIVTALLILISLLNYILIAISSMVKRSREVGVRKCYGAEGRHIYRMLTREALSHIALALVLSSALIFAGRNLAGNLLGVPLQTLLVPQSIVAIAGLILFILLVSIVVPSELYQRIPVYVALKNYREHSRRWKLGLLGIQVLINVFLVVMMLILGRQYALVSDSDPGYNYKNVLFLNMYDRNRQAQMRAVQTLEQLPEVTAVATCFNLPFMGSAGDNIYLPHEDRELFNIADQYEASESFFDLLDIPFIEGRPPRDYTEVAVDENFVARMSRFADWSDGAVGKQFRITGHDRTLYTVSGVYRNYLIGTILHPDGRPSAIFWGEGGRAAQHILFKVKSMDDETFRKVREALEQALDKQDLTLISYEYSMLAAYDESKKMRNTMAMGAAFSLLIALLGLIAFIRDESLRRSKEMAVRKINGATPRDILSIFAWDILKLSSVMAVIACAAALFVARDWLKQFSEQVALSLVYFAAGALIVLAVIAIVVVLDCLRLARANPVDSLKNE